MKKAVILGCIVLAGCGQAKLPTHRLTKVIPVNPARGSDPNSLLAPGEVIRGFACVTHDDGQPDKSHDYRDACYAIVEIP